jgi:hypothetical protein
MDFRILFEPICGIHVMNGLSCSSCPYVAKQNKSYLESYSTEHKEDGSERLKMVERKIQRLFRSTLMQYG